MVRFEELTQAEIMKFISRVNELMAVEFNLDKESRENFWTKMALGIEVANMV